MLDQEPGGWTNLFPTKKSLLIFILYIFLSINHGLLVKISQNTGTGSYNYNVISAVLLTELCKLVISLILFWKDNPLKNIIDQIKENKIMLFLYMIPALLYCFYNNLAFVNLSIFDPTTYFILLQLRVILIGVIYQCLFKKRLSKIQWFSLLLLTFGCIVKELKIDEASELRSFSIINGILLMSAQIFCSCLAGVYNEYLLKNGHGSEVNVYVQNIFMYADSMLCNFILWLSVSHQTDSNPMQLDILTNFWAMSIVINSAIYGIVTSLLLCCLNSIMKVFATAIELILIALLSWIILGYQVTLQTIVGVCIVSGSVIIYAKHPVTKTDEKSKESSIKYSNNV
ncbi:UDP-galactose transporter senju [Daktulosphaira vitifoliae]|uniref:UDP-galactose transporter senju n=1 Tax=Daktulosphaira vitifoliae TaxID=58002 RepID=UPI0021A98D7A|nr:UDP-galactose transporter senju [Daktulosphaira vitifoliae]